MKKYGVLAFAILAFASCNNTTSEQKEEPKTEEHKTETVAAKGPKDPVCEMEKDNTWTEFSVANNDTTWFCSPHCKEAYAANPGKYSGAGAEMKK
jgi:YHS domain-containing protein